MADELILSNGVSISSVDTPTRSGERIRTLNEVGNIPTPYVGMMFYVEDMDRHFYVKSLKAKMVSGVLVPNAQVETYASLSAGEGGGEDIPPKGVVWVDVMNPDANGTPVDFYRGAREDYDNAFHGQGIYFALDTKEILHQGMPFTGELPDLNLVKEVYLSEDGLKIVIEKVDGSKVEIPAGESTYESHITDKSLTMPNAVGGLSAGTKVSDLEGKTFSEIFDAFLFPTINPTYVAPSATIKFNGYANIQEVGAAAPSSSKFTTSFNRGAINLGGTKQADRAGALTSGEVFCVGSSMPSLVPLGDTQYKYRANYAQGPQPKDSKGNNYGTPLPSGSVESDAITLNGTYPWYIGTTKQTLVAWSENMSTGNFTLSATGVAKQIFKLPRTLKEMQMLNTISGKMEVVSASDWEITSESLNGRTYYVYTYIGAARGSVTLLVKF